MRRAPEPTELSETITIGPISAVHRTWVPPQSSVEKPGISTTRTSSPYFSPKSIIAPSFRASSIGVTKARTGRFSKIFRLTRRSTSSRCSRESAWECVKSKRSLSGRTAELGENPAPLALLERADLRQHVDLLVADELRPEARRFRKLGCTGLFAAGSCPGALALLAHQTGERLFIDREAPLERELARQ